MATAETSDGEELALEVESHLSEAVAMEACGEGVCMEVYVVAGEEGMVTED